MGQMNPKQPISKDDAALLEPFLRPERLLRMDEVLAKRTRNVSLIYHRPYDPHNTSAALRTADAFGIQDVHLIFDTDSAGRIMPNTRISRGAFRWVSVHHWNSLEDCIGYHRKRGLRIAVGDLEAEQSLENVDLALPIAFVFGNEHDGVNEELRRLADLRIRIPMVGFVESLNISVATALCAYSTFCTRESSLPNGNGDLSDIDKENLRARWIYEDIRRAKSVLTEVKQRKKTGHVDFGPPTSADE